MVDRLSTNLIFSLLGQNITDGQRTVLDLSKKINSGKKFTSPYDDPVGLIGAIGTQGRILSNDQSTRDRTQAKSQLEGAEIGLRSMNDITNRINELTIRAANDSASSSERNIINNELKSLVSSFIQLTNTKVGDKYVFSGQQSDLQTIRLNDGASYTTAIYKHNQDNGKQRIIDGNPASLDLKDLLVGTAEPATLGSQIINPTLTSSGNLDFTINSGTGNDLTFTANLSSGDSLTSIITKINTAFTTAGGLGSIAQESPAGYLNMDTSLITGDVLGRNAKIQVLNSSDSTLTNALYIKKQVNSGKEAGIFNTFQQISTALTANDGTSLRSLLGNLDFNSSQLNSALSKVGLLVAESERFDASAEDLDIKLQADLSEAQDVDFLETNIALSNAQIALQTAVRTSSNFFNQSLSGFLG